MSFHVVFQVSMLSQKLRSLGRFLAWAFAAQARLRGFPDSKEHAKWRNAHAAFKPTAASLRSLPQCSADDLFLHLPRQRSLWNILLQKHSQAGYLAADLSQSVQRAADRTDWSLPTITPRSIIAISSERRVLAPVEKILLHGFPVHRMRQPKGVTDSDLETMGGNTMHVNIVGAAMLMALGLVAWERSSANAPCQLPRKGLRAQRRPSPKLKALPRLHGLRKPSGPCGDMAVRRLAARWGVCQRRRPHVRKSPKRKATPKPAKSARLPPKLAALRGTRWG